MKVSRLTARLRDEQAPVARRAMERSVLVRQTRLVIRAHRVAGAEPKPFQGRLKHAPKAPGHFDKSPSVPWLPELAV